MSLAGREGAYLVNDDDQLSFVEDPAAEEHQGMRTKIDQGAVQVLPEFRQSLQSILVANAVLFAMVSALKPAHPSALPSLGIDESLTKL